MRPYRMIIALLIALLLVSGCSDSDSASPDKINVVVTTGIIGDAVHNVGGTHVHITQLIGPGVDPHHYIATDSDKAALSNAQIVFYNGLGLEAGLTDLLTSLAKDKPVIAVAEAVSEDDLLNIGDSNVPDPHVWMNARLWLKAVDAIRNQLSQTDPATEPAFRVNAEAYKSDLLVLNQYIYDQVNRLPPQQRVLVTAHDAFRYFARAYGLDVFAPQDASASAASSAAIQSVEQVIRDRKITTVFVESALPQDTINTIVNAVSTPGQTITIGGVLATDTSGQPGTGDTTYEGMLHYDVDTIVTAITGTPAN